MLTALQRYIQQFTAIEKEWYSRKSENPALTERIATTLLNNTEYNHINLTGVSLKTFVRSYRAAFEKTIQANPTPKEIEELSKSIGTKKLSGTQLINKWLQIHLKHELALKVGGVKLDITTMPSTVHLGNGHVRNVGRYSDIWPMLSLITDNTQNNNKKLAELFLNFADTSYEFTRQNLEAINPKFSKHEFDNLINYYCKFLTGIALHYIFYEAARRVLLSVGTVPSIVEAPAIPVASSIIIALKALRDGNLTSLEDVFSPESKYVLITHEGVSKLAKAKQQSLIQGSALLGAARIKQKHKKENLSPFEMRNYALSPDSEKVNPEDTETYPGQTINIPSN